jgi:hypothetical protein
MKIDAFPGVLTKQKKGYAYAYVLTDEQREWLCKWFPEEENSRLMKASGMSHSTLHRFARELHLTKSTAGMKRIKRRQARQIKRVCERNGYYASLRGRPVSEACREGTARMWQEIREGRREHPARILRRTNPRRYRQWMKNKSHARKEVIRKEKLRVKYGLERKTRLRCIVMVKYTRSQVCRRYNALRRGYILMQDCSDEGGERYNIYYDEQTQRSEAFEQNLQQDGFHVLPLVEQ